MPISTGLFTMPAAPGVSSVAGLGYAPPAGSALQLWCVGSFSDGVWATSIRYAYGFTDGTNSYSSCASMDDNVNPTQTFSRAAAKVITICDGNGVVLGECDFTSWDADGFTVTWTVAGGSQFLIAYQVIAGDGVQSHVQEWQALANGNRSLPASGFTPQAVFFHSAGLIGAAPASLAKAQFNIGVMDYNGSDQQTSWWSNDNRVGTSNTTKTDVALALEFNEAIFANPSIRLSYVSMDANGYTVVVSNLTKQYQVYSLEIAGLNDVEVGRHQKAVGVGLQNIPTNFQPNGIFCFQSTEGNDVFVNIGACGPVGTDVIGVAFEGNGNNPSQDDELMKTGESFIKVQNNTQTINAEGHIESYNAVPSFTIHWTVNDGAANPAYIWIVFDAPDVTPPPSPTIPAPCDELEARYEVWLLDHNGDRIHLLDGDVEVLEYVIATNGSGSRGWGSFRVEGSADLLPVQDFTLDRIISVRRKYPCGDFRIEFEGFIRRVEFWFDQIDKEHVRVSGPDLKSLVRRRIIMPAAADDWFVTTDELTDIMRYAVRYQGGPLTIDADRKFQLLSVEADTDEGDSFTWRARYVPLDEELMALADAGASFDIERETDVFTFKVFFPRQGLDLRKTNPDGNTPTVFSLPLANMRLPAVVDDRLQEKNIVYVGGDGIGSDRDITERSSLWDAQDDSPYNFNRIEAFVEAGQESSAAGRAAQGDAYLAENRQQITFSFQAHQTIRTLYEQDWDIGDLVTAEYRGVDYDVRIDAVRVRLDAAQGEQIFPTFRLLPEELV